MTSSINVDGFLLYVKDGLSASKDGKWFDYFIKLLDCVLDEEIKQQIINDINLERLLRGWEVI